MGKIKEGKGSTIGNAGEYLVVGELLKRGIITIHYNILSTCCDGIITKNNVRYFRDS